MPEPLSPTMPRTVYVTSIAIEVFAAAHGQIPSYILQMITGPLIAEIAGLVGEPARANMLSALVDGRYDMVPIPDAKLGPRKLDVASTYDTERYRPTYDCKLGLPIFLTRE